MESLTRRDFDALQAITGFIKTKGYSPSFEEIGHALGVRSLATVHKRVKRLKNKGFIAGGFNKMRDLKIVQIPRRYVHAKVKIKCPNCQHEF